MLGYCKHTYFFRITKENPLIFAKRGANKKIIASFVINLL
nr:MAG TPA: hypothetical protein [Caudoviricetes sp.]